MKKLYLLLSLLMATSIGYSQLIINEVLYDPSNNALDGDANGDGVYSQDDDSFIEFYNNSSTAINVGGYQIWDDTSATGTNQYTIPAGTTIPANEALLVFGGGTLQSSYGTAVVLNASTGLNFNNSGEVIGIKDASGNWVLFFDSDALSNNPNESYTRNADVTGTFEQHGANSSVLFSPGTRRNGTAFSVAQSAANILLINEVLYDPSNNALDGDANGDGIYGQDDDSFIEIYNTGTTPFDVSGFEIWDDTSSAGTNQYTIPAGTMIPAEEVLVVFGGGTPTGEFGTSVVLNASTGLNFNNSGEVIGVKDTMGNWALIFNSDALSNNPNESYTRFPDVTGNFLQHGDTTTVLFSPGTKVDGNAFNPVATSDGRLLINEVLYDPSNNALDGDANRDGVYSQDDDSFIEIYNPDTNSFDISGWQIWDDTTSGAGSVQYTFPSGTTIPGEEVVVVFGGGTPTGTFGSAVVLTAGTGLNFNNSGEIIGIKDAAGNWAMTFDSDGLSNNPNESYTRYLDVIGRFEQHSTNTSVFFTPGAKVDGTPFNNSTGIVENQAKIQLKIYPNPVENNLNLDSKEKIELVEIYQMDGKLVGTYSNVNQSINVANLNDGYYLIKVISGNNFATQSFLKK